MKSIPILHRFSPATLLLASCALIAASTIGTAQSWTKQAPLPTGSDLFAVQMINASEFWAGGGAGTLVHTTDAGQHWQSVQLNTNSLSALFFLDAQHGWAAGNGFFHTTDGGQSWIQDNTWGSIYELFFLDAQRGWACGNGGVTYRTSDGGLHWAYAAVGPIATLSSIIFVDAQRGWTLNIDGQIYQSLDGGQSWSLQWNASGRYLSTLQFFDAQEGWAIGGNTFLHTTDGGQSWMPASVPSGTWSHGANFSDRQHGISVGEYGNITLTSDGGQHWTTIQPIGSGPRLWDVHFTSATRGLYCGETGGLDLTTDGGQSWSPLQSGGTGSTHALDAVDALHAWAANDGGEVLYTEDGGVLWRRSFVSGFDVYGRILDVDFLDTTRGWAVGRQEFFGGGVGRIVRSTDGGRSWEVQFSADDAYFQAVEVLDAQSAIAFGGIPNGPGLWMRTIDGGQNWTNVAPSAAAIYGADFVDANTGWAVGGLIYKTIDGGQSWTQQSPPPALLTSVSFADAQNGWAVGWSATILHTTDGGQHWVPQSAGSPTNVLFAVHAVSPTTAWIAGGGSFVARTTNGGASWQSESVPGADPVWPFEAAAFLDADHGWIGGGAGVWRREGPGTCPSPQAYCVAKPNSAGGLATLAWTGTPSVANGPFAVTVSGGLPNKLGLFFTSSTGPASIPFNNGTLCVQPPLARLPVLHLDASGAASQPVAVTPGMVGTTRWYQFFHRDPQNPDGTGLALSNGLVVTFCD